jgi:hypothetical protein
MLNRGYLFNLMAKADIMAYQIVISIKNISKYTGNKYIYPILSKIE